MTPRFSARKALDFGDPLQRSVVETDETNPIAGSFAWRSRPNRVRFPERQVRGSVLERGEPGGGHFHTRPMILWIGEAGCRPRDRAAEIATVCGLSSLGVNSRVHANPSESD